MYKSVIDLFEIQKGKTTSWFARCQNAFLGLYWGIGGIMMTIFGIFLLLSEPNLFETGIILVIVGSIGVILFLIARIQGNYFKGSFFIAIFKLALAIIGLLYTKNVIFAGILLIFFPMEACMFYKDKRGTIISGIMLVAYLICGFMFLKSNDLLYLFAFSFVMILITVLFSGFIVLYEAIETSSDNKISDIQKETEIKNKFISQLSYQIRTPLNNIMGIGNLLNETQLDQRQKDWLETIIASANNLISVVNIISSSVTSSGIVNAKQNNVNVSFNMQKTMDNVIQLFIGQSEEYNIGLKPNMEPEYIFEGDPIQIKQIFMTLIDNIIVNKKAEKINIFVSYRIKQETERQYDVYFEVKVSDHFDFDLEDERNTGKLNFSISSQLIAMTGDKLKVTHDNNFTIFTFKLSFNKSSLTEIKDSTSANVSEKTDQKDASSRDTSKVDLKEAKILLVEDNLINQKIVILSIQKLVKSIDIANNGQEAVDKFNDSKYEIILMDLQMPVMDGIQATKKIREIEVEKRILPTPIIAITANALAGDREHCLSSGMDEYISKPFQVEMLVSKMKNLLAIGSSIHQ